MTTDDCAELAVGHMRERRERGLDCETRRRVASALAALKTNTKRVRAKEDEEAKKRRPPISI